MERERLFSAASQSARLMAVCSVEMPYRSFCEREAFDQDGHCYFHSEGEKDPEEFSLRFIEEVKRLQTDKGIDVMDFSETILPELSLPEAFVFEKHLRLRRANFSSATSFRHSTFNEGADFNDATFQGDATFQDATFEKNASFERATFEKRATFIGATFREAALFALTTFKKLANFGDAKFEEHTWFGGATFEEGEFADATFVGRVHFFTASFRDGDFRRVTFEKGAAFLLTTFEKVNFESAVFQGWTTFQGENGNDSEDTKVTFGGTASFVWASVPSHLVFMDVTFGEEGQIDFRHVYVAEKDGVEFIGFSGSQDMTRVRLLHTDVTRLRFRNVRWGEGSQVYDHKLAEERRGDLSESPARNLEGLYRDLRWNYEESRRYPSAGDFYIHEMELRRLRHGLSLYTVYKLLSRYGESYRRAGAWIFISIGFFALLRMVADLVSGGITAGGIDQIADYFVQSFAAFFQFGGTTVIDGVERLWSLVVLALFVLALRRRFMR